MKKYLLTAVLFVIFANNCFAAEIPPVVPGKVLPIKWDTARDPLEFMNACPSEELIENTMGKAMVTPKTNVKGGVVIVRAKTGKEELLSPFMSVELEDGDRILSHDAGATITFSDGSVATMGYATNVKYYTNEKITKLELLAGKFRILLPSVFLKKLKAKVGAKLETKMRVSAACVRGTDYIMEYDENTGIGKYYLNEGTLDVVSLTGEALKMEAGTAVSIGDTGEIISRKMNIKEWDQIMSGIGGSEASSTPQMLKGEEKESDKIYVLGAAIAVLLVAGIFYRRRMR